MKKILLKTLSLPYVLIILASCSNTVTREPALRIDLSANISEGELNYLRLIKIVSVITPEFTDSTIISFPQRIDIDNNLLSMRDRKSMQSLMAFDLPSGKALATLNRQGEGPEEYNYILGWGLSSNKSWGVFDFNNNIFEYTLEGSFISKHTNDTIFSLYYLPSDKWVARTSPKAKALDAVVFDTEWKNIASVPSGKVWSEIERENNFDNMIFDFLNDGKYCLMVGDTILQLNENDMTLDPIFTFDMGKYKLPSFESQDQWINTNQNKKYIRWKFQPSFNDRYIFLSYNFGENLYFDVFDLKSGELKYRSFANEDNQVFGMPIKLPQGEVRGWPLYSLEDKFYFMVPDFEAEGVLYENDETNPPILVVTIE